MWRLRTLGGLRIEVNSNGVAVPPRRRPLALLAVLAIAGESGWGREKIAALLWPESNEEHARNSLSQALARLRRDMKGRDPIVGGSELCLDPSIISSDVVEFERSIAIGSPESAVVLYHGPFLDGFFLKNAGEFERWAAGHRRRLHDIQVSSLERLAHDAEERADHVEARNWWRQFAELEPTSAVGAAGLMRVLAATGDRAGALRLYREHESVLRRDFGVVPEPGVSTLAESLSDESTASTAAARPPMSRDRMWHAPTVDRSVAVMPLTNLVGDRLNDYFAEGLGGEMANALATAGLRVIGPRSTQALGASATDPRSVGKALGVGHVIHGTIQRAGNRLRITICLVSSSDASVVWGETYEQGGVDGFVLQDEIADTVAAQIQAKVAGGANAASAHADTNDPEAHALYPQALYQWNRRTAQTLHLAINLFQRAIRRDADYARAYAGMSMAYVVLPVYSDEPMDQTRSHAVDAASRALAIDNTLAEAHAAHALASTYVFDNALAKLSFERALALDPQCAIAHFWHALLLGHLGHHDEAICEVRLAHSLEPASLVIQSGLVEELFYARRYEEAESVSGAAMALDPTFQRGLIYRARVLIELRRFADGIAILERLCRKPGLRSAEKLGLLAYAYARAGRKPSARATLARVSSDPLLSASGDVATALDALGDRESAVAMCQLAIAQHDQSIIAATRSEPYDRLRKDRRIASLFARIESPN